MNLKELRKVVPSVLVMIEKLEQANEIVSLLKLADEANWLDGMEETNYSRLIDLAEGWDDD